MKPQVGKEQKEEAQADLGERKGKAVPPTSWLWLLHPFVSSHVSGAQHSAAAPLPQRLSPHPHLAPPFSAFTATAAKFSSILV